MHSGSKKRQKPVRVFARVADPAVIATPKAVLDTREMCREERQAFRMAIANEYVFHPRGVPLAHFVDNPDYGGFSKTTIEFWCKADEWVARRKAFGEQVKRKVEASLANRMVQQQIAELRELEQIQTTLLNKIKTEMADTPPKSYEAAVTALLKVNQALRTIRDSVKVHLVGRDPQSEEAQRVETAESEPAAQLPAALSEAEIHAAAKAALRVRREEAEKWAGEATNETREIVPALAPRKKKPPPEPDGVGPMPKNGS